jgi:2-haloacid dehalogenase
MQRPVIFDLGGVLIDWDPRHLYRKLFPGDEAAMERFLGEVCTMEWHIQHDAGRPFVETCGELKLKHPDHAALIDAYGERYQEMIAGAIDGTVVLLERLAAGGVPLYAITNYPAQAFPWARQRFGFLALFRDIAVSGDERIMKPDAELFRILFRRNNLVPEQAIFIDDSIKNIDAARALGLHAIHFRSADQIEQELLRLDVLRARA